MKSRDVRIEDVGESIEKPIELSFIPSDWNNKIYKNSENLQNDSEIDKSPKDEIDIYNSSDNENQKTQNEED